MSLLKYFRKAPQAQEDLSTVSRRLPDHDATAESSESEHEPQSELDGSRSTRELQSCGTWSSDASESQFHGACNTGWSSSLPEISDSEEQDPSLLLAPVDSHARDIRIRQGPYQPKLSKYKVTVYRGRSRSFCKMV